MTGHQVAALQHLVRDMQAAGEHLRIVEPSVFVSHEDFAEARAAVAAIAGEPPSEGDGKECPWAMWHRILTVQVRP